MSVGNDQILSRRYLICRFGNLTLTDLPNWFNLFSVLFFSNTVQILMLHAIFITYLIKAWVLLDVNSYLL